MSRNGPEAQESDSVAEITAAGFVCVCVSQGQLSVAPQHLCSGLLHHHAAVYGPPLRTAGVQRGRAGQSTHTSNL